MEEKEYQASEFVINKTFSPILSDTLDDIRYYQLYGGRGSGKSLVASIGAVLKASSNKFAHRILYLRQTMVSIEDSSFADVKLAIKMLGMEADFGLKKQTLVHRRTGNTISFKGIRSSGNASAKLKSLSGITTLIIEEAEEVESFEEFSKVDESIRVVGIPLKIILVYNPTSAISSWIHKEWFKEGLPKDDRNEYDTCYMHSTYLDNIENLAPSVVQRYNDLAISDPIYYKNTILAEWTLETSGRVYAGWNLYPQFNEVGEIWYGLDFGYGGKDSTSLIEINHFEGTYYVKEIFSQAKLGIGETIDLMKRKGIPKNALIFADYAVPILLDEIRIGGFSGIRKCIKGDVKAAIKKVQDKKVCIVGESPKLDRKSVV